MSTAANSQSQVLWIQYIYNTIIKVMEMINIPKDEDSILYSTGKICYPNKHHNWGLPRSYRLGWMRILNNLLFVHCPLQPGSVNRCLLQLILTAMSMCRLVRHQDLRRNQWSKLIHLWICLNGPMIVVHHPHTSGRGMHRQLRHWRMKRHSRPMGRSHSQPMMKSPMMRLPSLGMMRSLNHNLKNYLLFPKWMALLTLEAMTMTRSWHVFLRWLIVELLVQSLVSMTSAPMPSGRGPSGYSPSGWTAPWRSVRLSSMNGRVVERGDAVWSRSSNPVATALKLVHIGLSILFEKHWVFMPCLFFG